ncbi:MAG TPA: tol-pal system-associated acyl-CoA thioesterase [Burkholderiales bacterium]|nr:tol-pal system-associated acyl-CoA thioesterase [Burkholderiales bacterium]
MRVYYQDTDAGGVVFHATYLHFLERARMEWMRARGFDARELASRFGLVFIVRQLEIAYMKPAVLDDLVTVSAQVQKMGRAQLTFLQEVWRGEEALVKASVNVACVASDSLKPAPFPESIRVLLEGESPAPEATRRSVQPRGQLNRV